MRFCVIGVGAIGATNVPALMAMPEVEIVAIANRTVAKAQNLCDKLGLTCSVYSDWREMLTSEKPEAVLIQLYNDMHFECFMECARRGIHILVEKPLANRYEDCLQMIEAARENRIRASVLQTQRYGRVLQTAKAYLDSNGEELGRLISVNDRLSCHYFWAGRNPWHLDPVRSGGGIVMNYGVHQLDRVHWLMGGKTAHFHSHYVAAKPGVATLSSYTMMGVSDANVGYAITCNGYSGPSVNEIDLVFLNGVVRCVLMDNGQATAGVYVGNTEKPFARIPDICEDGPGNHEMYVREMKDALDYLKGNREAPPITLEWAAEMVRLCNLGL
jgi:predicted dehydrogenase